MLSLLIVASISKCLCHEERSFIGWMRETNNLFVGDEYHLRLGIWLTNNRIVNQHNAGNNNFRLSMNHLSHFTQSEYMSLLGFKPSIKTRNVVASGKTTLESIDWRTRGIVNPVKNQGQCGSCWAFSAVQAQESQWAKEQGVLLTLSESNLVDCAINCFGCSGGRMDDAYDYILKYQNGMYMKENDYPYSPIQGVCKFDASRSVTKMTHYIHIAQGSENDLADKIAQYGVVAMAIDASLYSFQLYHSGIFDDPKCSSMDLNHCVGCVGFGSDNGLNFWIIRNSYSEKWGENGYVRMVKDKNNQCGEATFAMIPRNS